MIKKENGSKSSKTTSNKHEIVNANKPQTHRLLLCDCFVCSQINTNEIVRFTTFTHDNYISIGSFCLFSIFSKNVKGSSSRAHTVSQ